MPNKIIITDPKKFREELQTNDKLFDAIKQIVENYDADVPVTHEIVRLQCVATSKQRW
jgi:hypothetical protein